MKSGSKTENQFVIGVYKKLSKACPHACSDGVVLDRCKAGVLASIVREKEITVL